MVYPHGTMNVMSSPLDNKIYCVKHFDWCQNRMSEVERSHPLDSHSTCFLLYLFRENMVTTGRLVFLAKLAHVVKLAFQDSQEIKGALDQR